LVARLAAVLHQTPAAIRDEMTCQDVLDLDEYWKDHPPVEWMVQGYLGIKPRNEDEEEFDSLLKSLS